MKLFKVLLMRALTIKSEGELNQLCRDIDYWFQHDKLDAEQNEILYKIVNKTRLA